MPDGAFLVSDDKAGAIYRISYERGKGNTGAPGIS
jgi:glucose/arabinose dehydrogenase